MALAKISTEKKGNSMSLNFRDRLRKRDLLIGIILTLPAPELAEICADAGFDWLFLDMEHGQLDLKDVQRMCQAVGHRCPCLVRIPANEEAWIKRALDIGVSGLIVPQVKTAEETARAVAPSKYPPEGQRSVGITRAHRYGTQFQEYVNTANQETAIVIQVEHIDSVRNVDRIIEVPGCDAIFIGPYDLSASLGKTGQIGDPEVQQAIARVKSACAAKNFPAGIFVRDFKMARSAAEEGYSLLAVGMDITLFSAAARQVVDSFG